MDLSSLSVLVVDDFSTMRRIVINLLREKGFRKTLEAEDGHQALSVIAHNQVDVVLSDWNMPVMNGIELLKALRAMPQHEHLPFLVITAEARKENIVEAAHAGADGYIVKPFTANTLVEKLTAVLIKRGLVDRGTGHVTPLTSS
jgi:two-component system chemotaxis response regulator CheY